MRDITADKCCRFPLVDNYSFIRYLLSKSRAVQNCGKFWTFLLPKCVPKYSYVPRGRSCKKVWWSCSYGSQK